MDSREGAWTCPGLEAASLSEMVAVGVLPEHLSLGEVKKEKQLPSSCLDLVKTGS